MDISMRSILAAGVTAVAASAIVMAPSVAPLPAAPHVEVSRSVQLVAAVQTLAQPAVTSAAAAADPVTVPLNTASDVADAVYSAIRYWSGLGVYLIGWGLSIVPFGNFVSDQVYAFYSPTIYFTDSLVDNLIEPVLEDPTNPTVWKNGIAQAAYTGLNSLLNLGINEVNLVINYAINLIPAIPLSLAAPAAASAATATLAAVPSRPTSIPELVKDALSPFERLAHADTEAAPAAVAATAVTKVRPTRPVDQSVALTKSQVSAHSDKADSQPKKAAGKAGKPGRAAHSGKAAK